MKSNSCFEYLIVLYLYEMNVDDVCKGKSKGKVEKAKGRKGDSKDSTECVQIIKLDIENKRITITYHKITSSLMVIETSPSLSTV